jgi:hypothetical protein
METFASIMEMMMVVCFGISWPLNIIKAWRARMAKGTSLMFYFFIWIGYVFALIGKFVTIALNSPQPWYETVRWYVMFFYVLNIVMVSVGIGIYFRNKLLDKEKQ